MATHQKSIFGSLVPDGTGRAFFDSYALKATNDLFKHVVGVLKNPGAGEAHGFYGIFHVPQNYVGTAKIIPAWTSGTITGNVKLDFDYRAIGGDDAESLDQATFQESLTLTDVAPSAANERNIPSFSLTSTNLAVGDTVEFYITREDGAGTDTLADDITLHDLIFEYADA